MLSHQSPVSERDKGEEEKVGRQPDTVASQYYLAQVAAAGRHQV